MLPYTGAGSGIQRAVANGLKVQFTDNQSAHEFVITIVRESNHEIDESNHQNDESNHAVRENDYQSNYQSNYQKTKLTQKQKDICNFCRIPRTSHEIMNRLGISNQSKNRQRYITPLLKMGVLEMTIPENPKDKNQKYSSVKRK